MRVEHCNGIKAIHTVNARPLYFNQSPVVTDQFFNRDHDRA